MGSRLHHPFSVNGLIVTVSVSLTHKSSVRDMSWKQHQLKCAKRNEVNRGRGGSGRGTTQVNLEGGWTTKGLQKALCAVVDVCRESGKFHKPSQDTFPPIRKMAAPLLDSLSEYLGSPEPAVRLIFSILIGEFLFTNLLLVIVGFRRHDVHPRNSAQSICL